MSLDVTLNAAANLIATLASICKSISLYGDKHPFVERQARELCVQAQRLREKIGADPTFYFYDHELYCNKHHLPNESLRFSKLISGMSALGVGSLTLKEGLASSEVVDTLSRLVRAFSMIPEHSQRLPASSLLFEGGPRIITAFLTEKPSGLDGDDAKVKNLYPNRRLYEAAVRAADDSLARATSGSHPDLQAVSQAIGSVIEALLEDDTSLLSLTALKRHNEYTAYHSVNVAVLSLTLAARLGIDKDDLRMLGQAALLHDIGKVLTDKLLIEKEATLSADEWAAMRRHPVEGARFLSAMPGSDEAMLTVAYEHHLGYDLSGYPADFVGSSQHFFASICQLADVYDGVTSHRPYHVPHSPHQALKLILERSGSLFHPLLAREFVAMIGVYPIGSEVLLTDGRRATVLKQTRENPLRPVVRVERADKGDSEELPLGSSSLRVAEIIF